MNPFLATDGYKTSHMPMYPDGTTKVYCNLTPRSGKHAPKGCNDVVVFGSQMGMMTIHEMFDKYFFKKDLINSKILDVIYADGGIEKELEESFYNDVKKEICGEIKKEYSTYLGYDYDVSHIEALWDLGYLPIKVKSLPEGTRCPFGVPVMTLYNTHPDFFWLPNFLETLLSNLIWKPMTSATIADAYRRKLTEWAEKTDNGNLGAVDFQGHDFSMRGMDSIYATQSSGLGHATSFLGSDSLPVIHAARKYYHEAEGVVYSVPATEHSVMCAGGKDDEIETFRRLLKKFPTGILSIVSDTWDLWKVCTEILPQLKDEIMARDGKLVIRPDSGDPVDIICGKINHLTFKPNSEDYLDYLSPQDKGVVQLLWDLFGGTTNEQGYKVLDPHIGCIYGDSITLERAESICSRLEAKGFASTNIVLGIGSYTYQYNTRDTFGFAVKATYVEINEGYYKEHNDHMASQEIYVPKIVGREIFKDPITDDGTKKSAKGLLAVKQGESGYMLVDQVDWEEEEKGSVLRLIYEDGKFYNTTTLTEIRGRIKD